MANKVYQIKIALENIRPPIWRRILVSGDTTLDEMHDIMQAIMGWWDYHLHQFIVHGEYYGVPDDEYIGWREMRDEQNYTLEPLIPAEKFKFVYEYDFGDSWEHKLLVEKIMTPQEVQRLHAGPLPVCLKGKRSRPPEDVGGVWGYANFLQAIGDPEHPEHDEYLEWAGGDFDPERFDLEEVNQALQRFH